MFTFDQKTGLLTENGKKLEGSERCYAGTGAGRNNPAMQHVHRTGPLPRGKYKIGKAYKHPRLGPLTMNLDPLPGTQMHGRSAFRIHGDSADGDASLGCVVAPRVLRLHIDAAQDRILEVV